jgi:hypothetical protein|tara:strand:- start:376 stop:579 length:204 start_codon:yes stop_codon:yes gene_type:complete
MKNVVELRAELSKVFKDLSNGTVQSKDAMQQANLAGKMINSAKVQLEYHALRKDTPNIRFLHVKEKV